jgi:hypothetical protein
MATLGSKLVIKEQQWNANMTELNHLGKAMLARPTRVEDTMNRIFSAQNYYSDNPLTSMLTGDLGTEKEFASNDWEWDMKGADTRPLVVVADVEPLNVTKGKYRQTFSIKLDENWYLPGDVIFPGTSNKKYQARIMEQGKTDGDGTVYICRMNSDNPQDFFPQEYFYPGQQWGKLFSQYGEATQQSGSTQFSMPFSLRSRMGKYRKEYRITDYASTEVLAIAVQDTNGQLHRNWFRYAEVEFWKQWYREIERAYWYSRSTETVMDANGRPTRSGPGVQELLEDSHQEGYSHLTAKLIEEFLMDIFYGRVKPGQGRQVKAFTGEYGMLQFHRAIQDWQNKSGFIKNVEVYTDKVAGGVHKNSLEAGYQFVRYNMANGSSLELIHNPLYDDREINFEIDPLTGFPKESQRITFLDLSGQGNSSNIKLVKRKDSFTFGYVEGMFGPYGPKKGGTAAHAGDYYEMHVGKVCGVQIDDITKCGELILTRA